MVLLRGKEKLANESHICERELHGNERIEEQEYAPDIRR